MQFSDISNLPGPPLLERFFLVEPIPTGAAVLLVGLLLFEVLRRKRRERLAMLAIGIGIVGAAAIVAIGMAVVTPYERVRQATARFVELASAGKRDEIEDMLGGRFGLVLAEGDRPRDADWMLDRVEWAGQVVVSNQQVWRGGDVRTPNSIRTRMTLRTEVAFRTISDRQASTWDFTWQRDPSGQWKLTRLEAVSLAGQRPWSGWGDQLPSPAGGLP